MAVKGGYFDGQQATRWPVTVTVKDGGLVIHKEAGAPHPEACEAEVPGAAPVITWPRGSFEQMQGGLSREQLRFERGVEALVTEDRQLLVLLGRRPHGRHAALSIASGVVLCALLAGYFLGLPTLAGMAARRVPPSWEQKLGQQALTDLAPPTRRCTDPAANAALGEITARLAAAAPAVPGDIRATLVTAADVNAFATPGGYLIVNTALLARTKSPEELAGVLAHEIEHVRHHHPTQGILRALSTGALLALVVGDTSSVFGMATSVGELKYQRGDESQADEDGLLRMASAGIDPQGMVAAFRMLDKAGPDVPRQMRYLSSHPLTSERIDRLQELARALPAASSRDPAGPGLAGAGYPALLPGTDWAAIAAACHGDR